MMDDLHSLMLLFVGSLWRFCLGFFVAKLIPTHDSFSTYFEALSNYTSNHFPIQLMVQSLWTKRNAFASFLQVGIVFSYLERTPM